MALDMAHYHFLKGFYDHVVKTLGQEKVNFLIEEYELEKEQAYQEMKTKAEASGWEELERGVFTLKMPAEDYRKMVVDCNQGES